MIKQTKQLLVALLIGIGSHSAHGQTADTLIADLQRIHNSIKSSNCNNQQVISNRAMNIFLSDRIGYYLGDYRDLSLYKNNITYNSANGIFSLNHNLFQPSGMDEPIRSFLVVGARANAANAFAAVFSNKAFINELGITIKKSWISKPVTTINNCKEKNMMDISRGQQLLLLSEAIKKEEAEFAATLASITNEGLDEKVFDEIKADLRQKFYDWLQQKYYWLFAEQQYRELAATERFKNIRLHWTNASVYLPVLLQGFVFAESLGSTAANKRTYPVEVSVNHTRFWESKKSGRFWLTADATVFVNNPVRSRSIPALTLQEYQNAGGTDSGLIQRKINSIYIGNFKNFISTALSFRAVYFPHESHIGFSAGAEQNVGDYKALNLSIGIPVVLIDKTTAPAANFEFRVNCFDVSHKIYPGKKFGDNVSVSLTMGVPFSKIVF